MTAAPDRRRTLGWRRSDQQNSLALRGLLHDLGHDLATLAYLVGGMREDATLSPGTRHRVELIEQETARMLEVVRQGMWVGLEPPVITVRSLLNQIVELAASRVTTNVTLRPGPPVSLAVDGTLLWRMVSHLVEHAVQAAGPRGNVTVSASRMAGDGGFVHIDVIDDAPADAPGGTQDGPELDVVSGLAAVCGAQAEIEPVRPRGSRVRLLFPEPVETFASHRFEPEEFHDDRLGAG